MSCTLCGHAFGEGEQVWVGTVCGDCLDFGMATIGRYPSAKAVLRIAERCLLDVSDLWDRLGSTPDAEVVAAAEDRLRSIGRYVGTDDGRWFIYGGVHPTAMFDEDAKGSLSLKQLLVHVPRTHQGRDVSGGGRARLGDPPGWGR